MAKVSLRNQAIQKLVEKELERRAQEDIIENEQMAFKELKKKADNFLQSISSYSDMFKHESLVKNMQAVKDFTSLLYGDMRAESSLTQRILLAQHDFEVVLNQFLNRSIYLTHVSEEGNLTAYSDVAVGKIYSQATGNKGRGNIAANKLKGIDPGEEIKKINEKLKRSANKRSNVYMTAIKRWSRNDDQSKKTYKTFWWIKSSKYNKTSKIDTQGVIAEGYADAVINNRNDILDSDLENSLEKLWNNYIKKDSIPAAVKGDVILQGTNVQFAIKQGNFSSAKIGQYINLAYNIIQLNDDTLKRDFYLALPKLLSLSSTSEKIISIMNKKAQDTVFQLIKANVDKKVINSQEWNDALDLMDLS